MFTSVAFSGLVLSLVFEYWVLDEGFYFRDDGEVSLGLNWLRPFLFVLFIVYKELWVLLNCLLFWLIVFLLFTVILYPQSSLAKSYFEIDIRVHFSGGMEGRLYYHFKLCFIVVLVYAYYTIEYFPLIRRQLPIVNMQKLRCFRIHFLL